MKMPKNRILISLFLLMSAAFTGFAQVNEDELRNLQPVEFINYEGPYSVVSTWEEIRQIGVTLGQIINTSEGNLQPTLAAMNAEQRRMYSYIFNAGYLGGYFVIHSISEPDDNKLDADIFGLGVDVGVAHIRNLRLIVQGYLQGAYNYSQADAQLLAQFITIYNAVYRGNWDYLTMRYKAPVIGNLTRERAGLSIRYDEWPGRTLMVIPLGAGGLSSVDASVIADARIIEELRKEDEQGVPVMHQIIELLERAADEAEQQAAVIREDIVQEERQIAQERVEIAQERQETQQQLAQGAITPERASQAEQQLQQREQAVEQREQTIEVMREQAQELEEQAQAAVEVAQEIREVIREIQQEEIVNPPIIPVAQEITGGVYGVSIDRTSPVIMGQIIRLNPADGSRIRVSAWDTVHTRTVTIINGRIYSIAGDASRAVRLAEFDPNSLEVIRQGNDDIQPGSLLWVNGNDFYAIVSDAGAAYLGRFNNNLQLQARSAVRIHSNSSVSINQGRLLTQRENGSPMALNPATLELIW